MLAYLLQLNSIPRVVHITVNIIKDAACTVNAEKLVHIGSCATESQQKIQAVCAILANSNRKRNLISQFPKYIANITSENIF